MAQLERKQTSAESPKTPRAQTSPTFEQLLRAEDAQWSTSHTTPFYGMNHDQEEHISPTHNKRSVLTKVKEQAKKLRHSLSGKNRHGDEQDDHNSPPPWGVTLDDDDGDNEKDVDPEFLIVKHRVGVMESDSDPPFPCNTPSICDGCPLYISMYESELAPASYIENARQHPRAVPVLSEKHMLSNSCKQKETDQDSPSKTISETVSEKFAPPYAAVSDETHTIASKIACLTVTTPESQETSRHASKIHGGAEDNATDAACISVAPHANYDAKKLIETPGNLSKSGGSTQKWDKGVSMKEYFLNKLEPGEDEKALSQAIEEAISPRKSATSDPGVVDKVKAAVTSFFWHEEQSNSMAKAGGSTSARPVFLDTPTYAQKNRISTNTHPSKISKSATTNYSRHIPISTIVHEGSSRTFSFFSINYGFLGTEHADENLGRILQTN